jgi:hypothetical protein
MEQPVDGGGGQGLGHQFVEAGRVEVGADRHAAPLVGGVDEAEEALGGIPGDRQEHGFGMRDFTPAQAEELYELICARTRTGSIITTSNRSPGDWYALFPNAVLAESALDRLVSSAHHVIFRGRTYRPLRRPDGGGNPPPLEDPGRYEPHTDRSRRARAAESAQKPRHGASPSPRISPDDAAEAVAQSITTTR